MYRPETPSGLRLLAHELTHIVQQEASASTIPPAEVADREANSVASAFSRGEPVPAISVRSALTSMRQGFGEVRIAEARDEVMNRKKLGEFAGHLLEVQLKADTLRPAMSGDTNLADQQAMIVEHLDRTTKLLQKAGEGSLVDASLFHAIEVAIDAGGLTADLMYLDRLGTAAGVSRIPRAGVKHGLQFSWGVMRKLKDDPLWAVTNKSEADDWIRWARFHRDTVADHLQTTVILKAGVTAAQIVDLVVTGPQLLASGKAVLKGLAEWLTEGGGGFGILRAAGPSGALVLVSGGRTLVLTAEQVQALVQAGRLSANALVLYNLAQGGSGGGALRPGGGGVGEGPFGARPPGSKSRFTQKDIAKSIAEETGKVSTGERALEEAGVTARQLRKVEEYHHLLVRQLRRWFKARAPKLNIDDYTVKLTADEHHWIHNEYRWNDLWKAFQRENRKASPEEIIAQMKALQKQVGLEGLEIVPYPKSR
jgi:hypothetical protein